MEFKELKSLMERDRSIRRYDESRRVSIEQLQSIVGLVRYCASGRNAQPLKYKIVSTEEACEAVFPHLAWAGYYTDWAGPVTGQRPTAYLVQCDDTNIAGGRLCDDGLQLQAITLGAAAMGIGCCIIKAFNVQKVKEALHLPEHLNPTYVVAMGYPAEVAKIVEMKDGDFKYYRNEKDEQCVPKRDMNEIIVS
jgi:nitroreductase